MIQRNSSGESPLRVAAFTLGCRLNKFESDGILSNFATSPQYKIVSFNESPEIAIINSCTVTKQADSRNLYIIRKIKRNNPEALIIVTGCFAQTDYDKLRLRPEVDLIVGNDQKSALHLIIDDFVSKWQLKSKKSGENLKSFFQRDRDLSLSVAPEKLKCKKSNREKMPIINNPFAYNDTGPQGHTRAYLKIQEGCNRNCSYCKIPKTRGRGVSRPYHDIIEHIKKLEDQNIMEIVLTGVNPGSYFDSSENIDFNELLIQILKSLKRARVRVSSLEPRYINRKLAEITLDNHFCNFLHIPVQSGSEKILKMMRRGYSASDYQKKIDEIRKINPGIFLGTDIIIGFPGELDIDFAETLKMVNRLEFAGIHIFRFSPRSGTSAEGITGQIDGQIVKQRMHILMQESDSGWRRYAEKNIGMVFGAITEKSSHRLCEALTDNFLRLQWQPKPGESSEPGQLLYFTLKKIMPGKKILAQTNSSSGL